MRIISKFKDYYDYLQGVYGVDSNLILDRTDFCVKGGYNTGVETIYIGNYKIQGWWRDNKIYYGQELESFLSNKSFVNPFLNRDEKELFYSIQSGKR